MAKSEMLIILGECAAAEKTIAYSDLAGQLKTIHLEPDSYAMAGMLGEVSAEEDEMGRGMLSVLVVHKDGDMMPGPGFFELAAKLGRDTSDREQCWILEFRRVSVAWRSTTASIPAGALRHRLQSQKG